jgi:hypothetical protein
MIREYAIEPDVLCDWQRLRYFVDQCGVSKGRVIVRFPSNWESLVKERLTRGVINQNELKRVLAKLQQWHFATRFVDHKNARFDQGSFWIDNAIAEHRTQPFAAIVSGTSGNECPFLLHVDEVEGMHPLWKAETCVTIRRTAKAFADVVTPLTRISEDIIFADPYFSSSARWFVAPLASMLSKLARERTRRIEYHFCCQELSSITREWTAANVNLPRIIPEGLNLTLVAWPRGGFHNRFVLTNVGGIQFGHSLSEAGPRHEQEDEANLLCDESYAARLQFFESAARSPGINAFTAMGTLRARTQQANNR